MIFFVKTEKKISRVKNPDLFIATKLLDVNKICKHYVVLNDKESVLQPVFPNRIFIHSSKVNFLCENYLKF